MGRLTPMEVLSGIAMVLIFLGYIAFLENTMKLRDCKTVTPLIRLME